ncbi:MAG TPA: WXG100 family type VII secretion target [Pilimelia sp.]|nr:WXG100 family type VII secretion target [Pilimelia sp.]
MSDGVLVVKFAELQAASSHIAAALNTIEAQLGDLEQAAAPLVAGWEGSAREAYHVRQQRWRTAAQDLSNILRNIKGAVDQSAADYMNTEKKNEGLFS